MVSLLDRKLALLVVHSL